MYLHQHCCVTSNFEHSDLLQGNPGIAVAPNHKVHLQGNTDITSGVVKQVESLKKKKSAIYTIQTS
jgi:hypothetical protein